MLLGPPDAPSQPPPRPVVPQPAPTPTKTVAKTAPAPQGSMTPTQWAQLVAQDLGINVSQDPNAAVDILSWMIHEEPTSQWWGGYGTAANPTRLNPLNAGDFGQYGYSGQGSGLGSYPTLSNAAAATAQMIGQRNMAPILAALRSGADPGSFSRSLESTPWASSHYGGATFTAAQALQESQGPRVTNAARIGPGTPGASSAVSGAISSQTNPEIIANTAAANAIAQQLTLSPVELASQQRILAQNYKYSQQQFANQAAQLSLNVHEEQSQYNENVRLYQLQHAQDVLTGQTITDAINNITKQYGFQQQALAQQTQQGLQSEAASGVYNTGTRREFMAGQQLTAAQEKATEQYSLLQEQRARQQLGWTEAQRQAQYGYQQQQVKNGIRNLQLQQQALGISEAEARTQYQNALQQLNLNNLMNVDQLQQQIFALAGGAYSPLAGITSQLQQLIPGLAGAMKGN